MTNERCLSQIAGLLNKNGIVWALGASMLLACKGLPLDPRDIDILIQPDDAARVDALLRGIGSRNPGHADAHYGTRFFAEYYVDGVDVDIIGGFVIRRDGVSYKYTLAPERFEALRLGDEDIFLSPVEDWFILYALMPDREARVAMIEAYLQQNAIRADILRGWLNRPLPDDVRARTLALIASRA